MQVLERPCPKSIFRLNKRAAAAVKATALLHNQRNLPVAVDKIHYLDLTIPRTERAVVATVSQLKDRTNSQ
jgi:hypothetical protein